MRNSGPPPKSGLIIIARDATVQVITRLLCTRSREVRSAMKSAYSVLLLKEGATRVEGPRREAPTLEYVGRPLAAMSLDDLARESAR